LSSIVRETLAAMEPARVVVVSSAWRARCEAASDTPQNKTIDEM
jgi:hypothetical protein